MVTTLKDTDKPVVDVPFPSLTFCGTGVHLNNVQRKLILDFKEWRTEKNRNETTKEAIKKDTEDFMHTRFQIKPSQTEREHPVTILDMLDTMITPNVDASFDTNSVRENAIACKESKGNDEDSSSGCSYTCSDPTFTFVGTRCYFVSTELLSHAEAGQFCIGKGASLATISNTT